MQEQSCTTGRCFHHKAALLMCYIILLASVHFRCLAASNAGLSISVARTACLFLLMVVEGISTCCIGKTNFVVNGTSLLCTVC